MEYEDRMEVPNCNLSLSPPSSVSPPGDRKDATAVCNSNLQAKVRFFNTCAKLHTFKITRLFFDFFSSCRKNWSCSSSAARRVYSNVTC